MSFDPKTKKYPYPEDTSAHYLKIKKDRGLVFDKNYKYVDKSKKFRFVQNLSRILLNLIVFPLTRINMGLKIYGKDNLKKNMNIIKNGVISCSNHIHMWDYIAIMKAIKPIRPYTIVWDKNVNGESGKLVRLVGGIPISKNSVSGMIEFNKSIQELLNDGKWIQIYAEGSMWEYYKPIRPFQLGVATYSIRLDKPIIPMAFSYRKPNWFRRCILRQIALINLNIGEPIFKNPLLFGEEQKKDLLIRLHNEVCNLAGIDPKENIYKPIYNNDKRIDYYD